MNGMCCVEDKLDVEQSVHSRLTHNPLAMKHDEFRQGYERANQSLADGDSAIVVSYFLPVILSRSGNGEWQAAWNEDAKIAIRSSEKQQYLHVGTVCFNDRSIHSSEQAAVSCLLKSFNCFPVFLDDKQHQEYFLKHCEDHQYRVLHEKIDVFGPLEDVVEKTAYNETLRPQWNDLLTLFQQKVVELYEDGALVWIHGYELMLLPGRVRRKVPTARIGFFFHTPFPESDTWLTMFSREELLSGMLAADQIGFQLSTYARHFMSTCCRLLGNNYYLNELGQSVINVEGREVVVSSMHMGVDLPRLQQMCAAEGFVSKVGQWRERFRGKTIVAGNAHFLQSQVWNVSANVIAGVRRGEPGRVPEGHLHQVHRDREVLLREPALRGHRGVVRGTWN